MNDTKNELHDVNEIELVVRSLTQQDWEAIDLAAFNFAKDVAIDPEWLLKESLERIMDGRRRWPTRNQTPFRNFFCGVMKSIRNEVCKNLPGAIDCHYMQLEAYSQPPDEQIESQEREKWAKHVIETTFDHFSDDEHVMSIILGKSDGLSGEEIRNQEKMTRKQYDSALKRLNRYRNGNFSNGGKYEY